MNGKFYPRQTTGLTTYQLVIKQCGKWHTEVFSNAQSREDFISNYLSGKGIPYKRLPPTHGSK